MSHCPQCGFSVIAHATSEALAWREHGNSGWILSLAEVLKCPVSDLWHVIPLGGTGQLDMYTEVA